MTEYEFNFPTVYMETTPHEQHDKIREEFSEFSVASDLWNDSSEFDPLDIKAACELMDIVQACETMMGMYDSGIIQAAAAAVKARNRARGYYDDSKHVEKELDRIIESIHVESVDL